jgi:Lsr2
VATITRTYLTDDIDGSEDDVSTIQFALDGTTFEIDLSATNDERLREKLARFIDAATPFKQPKAPPVKPVTKAVSVASTKEQTQAIRDWAKAAGLAVSGRGRIAKTIQDAFEAAH